MKKINIKKKDIKTIIIVALLTILLQIDMDKLNSLADAFKSGYNQGVSDASNNCCY